MSAQAAAPCSRLSIDVGNGLLLIVRPIPGGEVSASLFVASEFRPSLSYAVGPVDRARLEEDQDEADRAVLWIDRAAFDVPIESAAELRAFLDAARGGAA